jgi:hypothetical protein
MGLFEQIVEAIAALFLIYIFGFVLLPAFGQATGQNTWIFTILYLILGIAIVFGVIIAISKRL